MKTIGIIGFGRFGKTLYRLLKDDFSIVLFNRSEIKQTETFSDKTTVITEPSELYKQANVIFFAIPIREFEQVIKEHSRFFSENHVLIDVLSVKQFPKQTFERHVENKKIQILLTHPMFGPDSSKNGFENLPIIVDKFRTTDEIYSQWKHFFEEKKLRVIEMSAEEHDKLAADSQGLTHFIGRVLDSYGFEETAIDSVGAKKLHEVKDQTIHDTWELFTDLQQYNPYTKHMRIKLGDAYDTIYNKLLPKQKHPDRLTIGIQGGKGSFNEEALLYYVKRSGIEQYDIKYLHTSMEVLQALHEGDIDRGQFALHNSVGGIVDESIEAMAQFKFTITDKFAIKIAHALMISPDAHLEEVDTIMTHPQVLAQCKHTLSQKYPQLKQTSGEGELIDHALVAEQLGQQKLPKNVATMGSKLLAELYNLTIIEDNLQDSQENYTHFIQVER